VNFAQGSSVMLGAVVCHALAVGMHWPMLAAIPVALLACALWGLIVERIAVRPFVARGANSWLMATVALGIVLDNVAMVLFGKEPRALPSALADDPWVIGNVGIFPLAGSCAGGRTGPGVAGASRHASDRPRAEAARGGRESRCGAADEHRCDALIALTYAAAALLAGIGGILIAPLYNVAYDMGTLFGIKAFAVAILGGLTNPWGVVIAGLAYGLVEACATTWLGFEQHPDRHLHRRHRRAGAGAVRIVRWPDQGARMSGHLAHEGVIAAVLAPAPLQPVCWRPATTPICWEHWRRPRWSASASTCCLVSPARSRSARAGFWRSAPTASESSRPRPA
jgi:branched-chain amino acid transport system permease protein